MNSLTGQFPIRVQRHNSACESNSAVSFFDRVSPKIITTSSAQFGLPVKLKALSLIKSAANQHRGFSFGIPHHYLLINNEE